MHLCTEKRSNMRCNMHLKNCLLQILLITFDNSSFFKFSKVKFFCLLQVNYYFNAEKLLSTSTDVVGANEKAAISSGE